MSLAWGGPVLAIRVMNEKQLLLILVGTNIILSFGKEYVKLAWEFTGKPGQENWNFWHLKKLEMTQKTRRLCTYWSPLYPGKLLLKNKGRSIRSSDIQKYLTWLKLQECKHFFWFKTPEKGVCYMSPFWIYILVITVIYLVLPRM